MNKNVIESLMVVNNHLIIPNYFIRYYKKFNLENNELLMLIYLLNCNEKLILDNKKILIKDNKYNVLGNEKLMNKIDFEIPNIIKFQKKVLELKGVKLSNRDNINDLIKDIYRSVK